MKKSLKRVLVTGITAAIACSLWGGSASAQDSLYEYAMTPISIQNGQLVKGSAWHNDAKTATIETSNGTGNEDQYYGHFFWGNVDIANTTFENNKFETSDGPNGGAAYFNSSVKFGDMSYEVEEPNTITITDSTFKENKVTSTGTTASIYSASKAGAVMIKGSDVTFTNVMFENNEANGGASAGLGGALYLDSTSNTANHDGQKRVLQATANFDVTKDMTYSGNKVSGGTDYSDTYGSYATTGGGFMYMDRGAEANFNIADGVTLKIGKDGETDANTDSISSAIRGNNPGYGENVINKNGLGTLTVNGSMAGYHGDLNVKEGTMNINQKIAGDAKITVSDGATLNLKDVELSSRNSSLNYIKTDGTPDNITLEEKNGELVAESGSKVTADHIVATGKSSVSIEKNADVTANRKDSSKLTTDANSNLTVKDAIKVENPDTQKMTIKGNFSGKLEDTNGNALSAENVRKVVGQAKGPQEIGLSSEKEKYATSIMQSENGGFSIQGRTYGDGGQFEAKNLASYDSNGNYTAYGNYDANGHDLQNVGNISAASLKLGQIDNVEDTINTNTANIATNAKNIETNTNDIKNLGTKVDTNTEKIASNANDIKNLGAEINTNTASINRLDSKINKVGANAAALAALHPLDFDPSDKWNFAAGVGNYDGENAMAVGAFYRPNEDVMFNVGGSFGSGENMVNAGVSLKFGQHGTKASGNVGEQEVKELRATVEAQNEKLNEQEKQIQELREMVEKLTAKA